MRYEVRACEGTSGLDGQLIGRYYQLPAARRRARKEAYDFHYGTIILDRRTGLVDYGDSDGTFVEPVGDYNY